ncbi:MAG: DUF3783 domain-containing protein [Selenomonas ruminantium]|uniref:DUF3783 domain-containing protein n=1 Tax=Selenomonas ruminantium TaxID=971 RepID=A0A927WJ05_SELRU|nr:DUF3783 domain-containing protein [Selenomonas ruminantium]
MKRQEQVLFYQFQDDEKLALACKTLHKMGIVTKILRPEDWREKVGYLLGAKGFQPAKAKDEDNFVFPHEVMVLQNIRNKRLDEVLLALKEAGVPHIRFKAVVTPFNTLWTLRRLCETMQKEHGAILDETR